MELLAASYVFNLLDYCFTALWVYVYGIEAEANPFGQWLLQNGTAPLVKIAGMAVLFILLGVLVKRCPRAGYAVSTVFGCYCLITVYHIAIALYVLS